jgi:hypothetical protein
MNMYIRPTKFTPRRGVAQNPAHFAARRLGATLTLVAFAFGAGLASIALAAPSVPSLERVNLDSLAAFRPVGANWALAAGLGGDPQHDRNLTAVPGNGILVCNPGKDRKTSGNLLTKWEHGDIMVELDFLLPPGSNSGVYLQGRYEIQLFDSWGVRQPKYGDCGGIYQRWNPERGKGNEGFEGRAPLTNACLAPGLWQHLEIVFEAPRFDPNGRKTRNARFRKVVLNGVTIHENVEVSGPTRAASFDDEKPLGPLMIQGNHGAVAVRAIGFRHPVSR